LVVADHLCCRCMHLVWSLVFRAFLSRRLHGMGWGGNVHLTFARGRYWDICRSGAATWRTGRNTRVVFNCGLFAPLYYNVTSSTKPEVHDVLHRRQRRTEPQPPVICIENVMKFGRVVLIYMSSYTDKQTDKQTLRHADHNTSHPYRGQSKNKT